jgi:hypothetical protein
MVFLHEYMRYLFYIELILLLISLIFIFYLVRQVKNKSTCKSKQQTNYENNNSRISKFINIWNKLKIRAHCNHFTGIKDGGYESKQGNNQPEESGKYPNHITHADNSSTSKDESQPKENFTNITSLS